jgi:hypothetical protein
MIEHESLVRMLTDRPIPVPVGTARSVNPVVDLQCYLDRLGVKHFTAYELARPRYPDRIDRDEMRRVSMDRELLIPAAERWPRLGALALAAERARVITGEPIFIRHAWRPLVYNQKCGGAPMSDHLSATALDLDFKRVHSLMEAVDDLFGPMYHTGMFGMSLGLGKTVLHVGLWSPRGQRRWFYDSADGPQRSEFLDLIGE